MTPSQSCSGTSGTQFDPEVIDVLLTILDEDSGELRDEVTSAIQSVPG